MQPKISDIIGVIDEIARQQPCRCVQGRRHARKFCARGQSRRGGPVGRMQSALAVVVRNEQEF